MGSQRDVEHWLLPPTPTLPSPLSLSLSLLHVHALGFPLKFRMHLTTVLQCYRMEPFAYPKKKKMLRSGAQKILIKRNNLYHNTKVTGYWKRSFIVSHCLCTIYSEHAGLMTLLDILTCSSCW